MTDVPTTPRRAEPFVTSHLPWHPRGSGWYWWPNDHGEGVDAKDMVGPFKTWNEAQYDIFRASREDAP